MSELAFHGRFGKLMLVVGGICTVGAIAFSFNRGHVTALTAPVLCLALGILDLSVPLLVFEHDHFAARPAALRGARRILYRDVRRLEVDGKKLFVHVSPDAGEPCKITLNAFTDDARLQILHELDRRTRATRHLP